MQYISYKNHKHIESYMWADELPEHWEAIRLGFLIEMLVGNPFASDKFEFEGGVKLVRGDNVTEGRLRWGDKQRCWPEVTKDIEKYLLMDGDVVIGMDGSKVGKNYALIQNEDLPLLLVQRVARLRSTSRINATYLKYLIGSPLFLSWVEQCKTDPMVPHITAKDIRNFRVFCPCYEEQQAIARFLDYKTAQIDELIAKKQTLLDKLAEKRSALISHAVTKGLDPLVPMKDSKAVWLGKIPIHWEAKRLKFVVSIFGGGTPNTGKPEYWNGEIPWVSPKDMKCDFIDATEDYLTDLGVAESATKIVPVDSVLIVVRSGILRHTIPVARNTVEVSLNQDMKALVASDCLRPGFIHWFIRGLQGGLLPLWSKQGCTVESIEMGYMTNTTIPLPPLDEQDAILEHISKITAKIDEQATKVANVISALAEYRNSLITHAVTGKIDVRRFQIPLPTQGGSLMAEGDTKWH